MNAPNKQLEGSTGRPSASADRKTAGRQADDIRWWPMFKAAAQAWVDDDASSMGAALSYYTVFSLAPLLLIVISLAGLMFGEDAAHGAIFGQIRGMMGVEAALAIEAVLVSVNQPGTSILATAIGVAVLLVGATTVFAELQGALDRIWRAPKIDKVSGLWRLLRTRLLSLGMIMGMSFLLMVSLVLGAVISALGQWWGPVFGAWQTIAQSVNLLVGYVLTTIVFAMIYKLMPRARVQWRDVWLGALVTSMLFTIGKVLISYYIGKSGIASGFGAAGSLIVVFLWVYYSAQVFLLGAEFTAVFARRCGSLRPPEDTTAPAGRLTVSGPATGAAAS